MSGFAKRTTCAIIASLLLVAGLSWADGKYKEAPALAALVKAGKLPPVDQRLPREPLVVKVVDSIGQYGGTWRRWDDHPRIFCWEPLVKVDIDGKFYPNVAQSWEINADKTKFTFHLREGIHWSDGEPYTSDDIMFWWQDIVKNPEYSKEKPSVEGMDITAPDAYTIVITFTKPQPGFMARQSTQWGGFGISFSSWPKHYLKQFHPKYADKDELAKKIKDASMDSWVQLLDARYWVESNPDVPVIMPWKLVTKPSEGTQVEERNPYYWKVDAAGNQLPYIDRATWPQKADKQVGLLKLASGEIDYTKESFTAEDIPVMSDNMSKGNYDIVKASMEYQPTNVCLFINQNYTKDPEMGDVLRNINFRKALSVAINRNEINEFINLGQSQPTQATVPASHPAGSKELSTYMTQLDVAQANKWLDAMGLQKKDSEGFRLLPSGKKLTLVLSPRDDQNLKAAEIIRKQYEAIGVRVSISTEDLTFWMQNKNQGLHMVSMYQLGNGNPELRDTWWVPINQNCYWAPLNGLYVASNGASGVKPTGDIALIADTYQRFLTESNDAKRLEMLKTVVDKVTRNLYMIGTVTSPPVPEPVKRTFHNVPKQLVDYSTRMEVWEYSQCWMDTK